MDTANVNERALPIGRVLGKRALLYVALLVFAFALVLLLNTSNASATTTINTDITGDYTMDTSDDYVIDGAITVTSTGRLFIDPGVYCNFTDGSSLTIEGYIFANGSSATNGAIRFSSSTGTIPGSWDGFYLNGPSGSRMVYFTISYADDAITVVDTTATISGTINFVSGDAVTYVRNTGNMNIALAGFVVNDAANGLVLVTNGGNLVATVTNCVMANVDGNAIYAASAENATVNVVGGLYTSPSAGMTNAVFVVAYWNATVSVSGGTVIYFAQSCAAALSVMANAVVSLSGVTFGNLVDVGATYAAGAVTYGPSGTAQVTLSNMEIRNATIGVFGFSDSGGVNIAVSDVTFENITWAGVLVQAYGSVTVTLDNVVMELGIPPVGPPPPPLDGQYGVFVISEEMGAAITMTDVSVLGNVMSFAQGSVYCDVNTTATVTATNFYANYLFFGLGVDTASGNANVDITNAEIDTCFVGIYVSAPNGAITARIDPTLINHSVYGVLVVALGNIALTLVDVDMNDTIFCVFASSTLGNVNFSWTNGEVTGIDTTIGGVYLQSTEGAVTASMTNVNMQMYEDDIWWATSGDQTGSMLYISANLTVSATVTDCSVANSWSGVWVMTNVGDVSITATGLETYEVLYGIYASTLGALTISATDVAAADYGSLLIYLPLGVALTNTVITGYSVGDMDITVNGLDTNFVGVIYLVSGLGDIDFVGTDINRPDGMLDFWVTTDMIWLQAVEGGVTAELSQVDIEMYSDRSWNGYGLIVVSNLSAAVSIEGFSLTNASNGVSITSLTGDVTLDVVDATIMDSVNNHMLVYALEGALVANLENVLVDHTGFDGFYVDSPGANGIVLQAMGDLDLTMTNVGVNDSNIDGVLMLSSMGNVNLDLTDVEVLNSGGNGFDVVAAMGTIDAVIDPSWIFNNDVGMLLDAAGAVTLDVMDTVFEDNNRGIEIHSQVGGITVTLDNAQFLNSNEFGLFAEADQDDVMVEGTGSYLSENYIGFFLRTFLGDIIIDVDNTTFLRGEYGIWAESGHDILASLVDVEFLGQSTGGVYMWAMHDAIVTYLRDNFDGSLADDAQLFLPSEVDEQYEMIDPDVWTTNSWLTVDLPWDFEFNAVQYDQVTMSRYGWIGFGVTDVNDTWNFGPSAPNMIAAAQNDYWVNNEYPGIGYKLVDGAVVFHWYVWQDENIGNWPATEQLKNVFEIWLFQDGDIEIRYAMMETKYAPNYWVYPYGVNFNGGVNWDLGLWNWDPFYNDWMAVHFTMERMSFGYASLVIANGNLTASVTHSSVSHWLAGGLIFECVDGVLEVEISDTTFEFLGGMFPPMGALALVDLNGTMNVEVTNLDFYFILGIAIIMWDSPNLGGVSSMAITECSFEQVVISALMWSLASNFDVGSFSLEATKTVERNLGLHTGMFAMQTSVIAPDSTWDITATTVFQDNDITGDLSPWLLSIWGPIAPPFAGLGPAQFYSYLSYMSAADGASTVQHDVSVMNNILSEAPYFGVGAVGIEDHISNSGTGSVTTAFNIDAQDNDISDYWIGFSYGIVALVDQMLSGTDAGATADLVVNVNYVDNVLEFDDGDAGIGLGAQAFQPVSGGLGTGILEFNANVVDNIVLYSSVGVYLWSEASAFNSWGMTSSDVTMTVQGNEIYAYSEAVDLNILSSAAFSHYFPPYEVPVDAFSDITFVVDVSDNDIVTGYNGVTVYVQNLAQEDYYGVFTSAEATSTGTIDVYQNYIAGWWWGTLYDNALIGLKALTYSNTGQATSNLDVAYSVLNNTLYGYGRDGIYIETGADASTLDYRYADTAWAAATATVEISGNQIWYAYDGVDIYQWADADHGESTANLMTTVSVIDNVVEGASDSGISIEILADVDTAFGSPLAMVDAAVEVSNNLVTGDGWTDECWAIDVEIYEAAEDYYDYYMVMDGSALITMNDVSDAEGGIYYLGYPAEYGIPVVITENTVDSCEYGIEADSANFLIEDNQVTNIASEGISVYGGSTGSILNNVVTGMPGMSTYGIEVIGYDYYYDEIDTMWDVLIQDNLVSDCGADGIYGSYVRDLTIVDNVIQNCGWSGIYLGVLYPDEESGLDEFGDYISEDVWIEDNQISNVGYNGVFVSYFDGVEIWYNTIDGVGSGYGIWVDHCADFDIMYNVVSNAYGGLAITFSSDGQASGNVLSTMSVEEEDGEEPNSDGYYYGIGIYVWTSDYIWISDTPVTGFLWGVDVENAFQVAFVNVVVTLSVNDGGHFDYVDEFLIQDCVFSMNGGDGLEINEGSDGVIEDVWIEDNFLDGLNVDDYSSDITVINGVFSNNGMYGLWFESPVDWIVDGDSWVHNNPVVFNGDLVVQEGGSLWLNMLVDFEIIGDSSDGLATITVEAGGMLTAFDVDFWLSYWDSPYQPMGPYYEFNVFGGLEFMNVLVTDALELYLGPTSTVQIMTSQIVYNLRNGIVVDGCAPVIMSSTIAMNTRNGLYVINGAAPEITDCMIASNARGMYVHGGDMSAITDNVFALNSEAGVLVEETTGTIRDNVFLLNNKEIYLKESEVSIEDNQIGYSTLIDVIVQFAPLLGLMDMGESVFIPMLDLWVSPAALSELLTGHIGVYATFGSVVSTSNNVYGMLTTGVMVVDSELSFNDDILSRTLMVPYMGPDGVIREMSLPVPVYDGIIAKNSDLTVLGGHIKVLDDAIFLDSSTADIADAVLEAGDFGVYAVGDTVATLTNVDAGKIKAADSSVITVGSALTVIVKDPWGNTLANVPVGVRNAQEDLVAQGRTDANGVFEANVVSYVQTSSGKDYSMHPYVVNASFGGVDTSGYPGHNAEFSPAEQRVSVAVPEPTTVVVQSNVIVKFYLSAKASDPNGKAVAGANVVFTSATGTTYAGTTDAQGMFTRLVVGYIQTPSGMDTSMEPYSVVVTFPAQGSDYGGRVEYSPQVVGETVNVEADMVKVVKTGIILWYELSVETRNRFNETAPGVYLVITDAAGNVVADGPTGEDGFAVFELVGYIQSADGSYDYSMNPYKVTASFDKNPTPTEVSVDMSTGSTAIMVQEIVTEFNWTQALTMALIGALILGIALMAVSRRD